MLEKDFGHQVEHLLSLFRWRWYHPAPAYRPSGGYSDSFHGMKGLPDYIAVRRGRLVFAELKNERGRLTPDQNEWLDELRRVPNLEVHVWRPADLEDIKEVLR